MSGLRVTARQARKLLKDKEQQGVPQEVERSELEAGQDSELEEKFDALLRLLAPDIPNPVRQFKFTRARNYRFDRCWTEQRVVVEIDGGQWLANGGHHARDDDRWKRCLAAAMGWRILPVSGEMLEEDPDRVFNILRNALGLRRPT